MEVRFDKIGLVFLWRRKTVEVSRITQQTDGVIDAAAIVKLPVKAICHGVRQPSYQVLQIHKVKDAEVERPMYRRDSALRAPEAAAVRPQQTAACMPDEVSAGLAESVDVSGKEGHVLFHNLPRMAKGMTIKELFRL